MMHCLSRGPVLSGGCLRRVTPKQCLLASQVSVHNQSQMSQPRPVRVGGATIRAPDPKELPLPKYVHNFYLPMGAKRSSFSERRKLVRERRIQSSQNIERKNDILKLIDTEIKEAESESKLETVHQKILMCNPLELNQLKKKEDGPRKPKLEFVSYILTNDLTNIFMQRQDWSIYRRDVVLQDNVKGINIIGLEKYMLFVNLLRMLAHARFVYVRMSLLSVTLDEEEGCVQVRWSIIGLGMLEFCLRYFPDRLWEKNSMERLSPSYLDGYSTFYVDDDSKIYRHKVEGVRRGKDKEKVPSMIQRIAEIVNRQPASQPAMMKSP